MTAPRHAPLPLATDKHGIVTAACACGKWSKRTASRQDAETALRAHLARTRYGAQAEAGKEKDRERARAEAGRMNAVSQCTSPGRPYISHHRYDTPCEVCGGAPSNHETGGGRDPHHYLCTECMNDWGEYCDYQRGHGKQLSRGVWDKWFADFKRLALEVRP